MTVSTCLHHDYVSVELASCLGSYDLALVYLLMGEGGSEPVRAAAGHPI